MCGLAKPDLKGGIVEISEVVDRAESRPVNVGERRLVIAGIETTCVDGVGGSACGRVPIEHGAQRGNVRKQRMVEGGPVRLTPAPALHGSAIAGGEIIERILQGSRDHGGTASRPTPGGSVLQHMLRPAAGSSPIPAIEGAEPSLEQTPVQCADPGR